MKLDFLRVALEYGKLLTSLSGLKGIAEDLRTIKRATERDIDFAGKRLGGQTKKLNKGHPPSDAECS